MSSRQLRSPTYCKLCLSLAAQVASDTDKHMVAALPNQATSHEEQLPYTCGLALTPAHRRNSQGKQPADMLLWLHQAFVQYRLRALLPRKWASTVLTKPKEAPGG